MKHKRFWAFALVLCLALPLAACSLKPAASLESLKPSSGDGGGRLVRGNGNVVEMKTPLSGDTGGFSLRIKGITLQGSNTEVELVIDESLPREVVITADDNIAERITVDYDSVTDAITVDLNSRVAISPSKLRIAVGAPVKKLDVNGAWRFTYDCPGVKDCEIAINGAVNGAFTFGTLDTLKMDLNGTGDIRLAGTARRASLTINGAANIKAIGLTAEAATVTINGAGNCEITATATLEAVINGLGNVVYGGDPAVERRGFGLGNVRKK